MIPARTRLYVITPSQFDLTHFPHQLEAAFAGGDIACVQLRMKEAGADEVLQAAESLMPICHRHGAQFLINDYPEIAKQVGADGVHVGDEDMSAAEARAVVGEDKVVGVSCYASKDRAYEAGEQDADYVAFGQFYETTTKPPKGRPGVDLLTFWRDYATIPSVAIGGIKPENAAPLAQAGADFIAVVTGVWEYPEGPQAAVAAYNAVLDQVAQAE